MLQQEDYQKCVSCKNSIGPKDEAEQNYTIMQCAQMIHKRCLEGIALK